MEPLKQAGGTEEDALLARAEDALRVVVDPELGVNVVDLGLVRGLRFQDGILELTYQLTSADCPIGGMMASAMREALEDLPGVLGVEARLLEEPPWSVEKMRPEGRKALGLDA